jgi:hypothetical protein
MLGERTHIYVRLYWRVATSSRFLSRLTAGKGGRREMIMVKEMNSKRLNTEN